MTVAQADFRAALLDPSKPRPDGLEDGDGQAAGRRFDVYRNNVAVSLTEALDMAFPVIRKLLGETNFKTLAGVFLRAHPPASPLMMFYGGEMPNFLASFEPTRSLPYLPDVARLELALRESYHSADSDPVPAEALQTLSPDALMSARLDLSPSLRLIRSPWPIYGIWRRNSEYGAPKPEMVAEDVIVVRPDLDPEPRLLPPGGGALVAGLIEGQTLGDAAASAGEDADLAGTLALLIGTNSIVGITEDRA